jgi:hypothetical protein
MLQEEKSIFELERVKFMDKMEQSNNFFLSYTNGITIDLSTNEYSPRVPDNIFRRINSS